MLDEPPSRRMFLFPTVTSDPVAMITFFATLVELRQDRVRRHKGGSPFDVIGFILLK